MNSDNALRTFVVESGELLQDIEEMLSHCDGAQFEPEWIDALIHTAEVLVSINAYMADKCKCASGLPVNTVSERIDVSLGSVRQQTLSKTNRS